MIYFTHDRQFSSHETTTIDPDIDQDEEKESEVITMATKKKATKKKVAKKAPKKKATKKRK
ncbi:MAG: hypothetical protein V1745_02515 [Patescibacteria group bacterium]